MQKPRPGSLKRMPQQQSLKRKHTREFRFEWCKAITAQSSKGTFKADCIIAALKRGTLEVRHPHDDAHIERFNRTVRKECIGAYNCNKDISFISRKRNRFIDYYNYDRIHLGINLRTLYEMLQG